MSISLESPIVCQIPGCTTTQMEIEAELASFLNSFCAMCRKDRGGKLCSCAFPCSLTFKSQMLVKIHELLGLEKPPDRRAIQVMSKKKIGFGILCEKSRQNERSSVLLGLNVNKVSRIF